MTRHTGGAGPWNTRQPDKHQHLQGATKTYVGLSTGGNDSSDALSVDKNPLAVQSFAHGSWSTSHANLVHLYLQVFDKVWHAFRRICKTWIWIYQTFPKRWQHLWSERIGPDPLTMPLTSHVNSASHTRSSFGFVKGVLQRAGPEKRQGLAYSWHCIY